MRLNVIDWIAVILLIVGGINWGLVGAFRINLVSQIFGTFTFAARLIYILVGISAVYFLVMIVSKKR